MQSQQFICKSDPLPYFSLSFANHSNSQYKTSNPVFASCFLLRQNHLRKDFSCSVTVTGLYRDPRLCLWARKKSSSLVASYCLTFISFHHLVAREAAAVTPAGTFAGNLVQSRKPTSCPWLTLLCCRTYNFIAILNVFLPSWPLIIVSKENNPMLICHF